MRAGYLSILAGALLGHTAPSQELSYKDSIHALANGNVAASHVESCGDVWLNITGFAVNELPHIQESVGITSLDNAHQLQVIAELVQTAVSQEHWGDVVFLYNVFSMNAHPEFASVASPQMQAGLLDAVTDKASNAGPDDRLIELYASTSSSPSLVEAFRALPKQYSEHQVEVDVSTVPATDPSVTPVAKREDVDQYAKRQVEVFPTTEAELEPTPTIVDKREANVDQYAKRQEEIPVTFRPSVVVGDAPAATVNKRQVEVDISTVPEEPRPTTVDKREANVDLNQIVFSAGHVAVSSACVALLDRIRTDASWKSGAPRNICYNGCCVSWSVDATFQIQDLYNAYHSFNDSCVNESHGVSCEAHNISLQGTLVNLCLSNRPNGCA
jgi:hypothetical protein